MKKYVIVRTYSAGCFWGQLAARDGREVTLENATRIWYWAGASSLSELAVLGTSRPSACKFPVAVPRIVLLEAIEIIDMTEEAVKSLKAVKTWTQH